MTANETITQPQVDALIALYDQGRFPEVLEQGTLLVSEYPDTIVLYKILAATCMNMGRREEAVANYENVLRLDPDYATGHNNLGIVLMELERLEPALASFERAFELDPKFAEAQFNAGRVHARLGNLDNAEGCMNSALGLQPANPEYLSEYGAILARLYRYDEATEILMRAISAKPDSSISHNNFGIVMHDLGQYDDAIKSFSTAIELDPNNARAHNNLGNVFIEIGRIDDAIASFGKSLEINPDYASAHYNLSSCKKFEPDDLQIAKMLSLIETAGPRSEERVQLGFALAKAHDDVGDSKPAFEFLKKANQLKISRENIDYSNERKSNADALALIRANGSGIYKFAPGEEAMPTSLLILGPSRSGKSTLEGMLAANPEIKLGYESKIVRDQLKRVVQSASGMNTSELLMLSSQRAQQFKELYLDDLTEILDGLDLFTNTNPENIMFLGVMMGSVPNVRTIFVRRDKNDQALRIYFKNYARNNPHAYHLGDIYDYLDWYYELQDLWLERYPEHTLAVSYEDMVDDPQTVAGIVSGFCGIKPPASDFRKPFDDRGCAIPYQAWMDAQRHQ